MSLSDRTVQCIALENDFRATYTPVYSCVASRGSIHTVTLSTGTTLPAFILSRMSAGMSWFQVTLSTTLSCSSLFTCKYKQSDFNQTELGTGQRSGRNTQTFILALGLTVISGKVFFMRLNIFLWDCRSPIVRGSLAPSFVLPFDFSFRLLLSRTVFTCAGEKWLKTQPPVDSLLHVPLCTPAVSLPIHVITCTAGTKLPSLIVRIAGN